MEITPHRNWGHERIQDWVGDGISLEREPEEESEAAEDTGVESQQASTGADAANGVQDSTRRRGGRKSNAQKAAEREAAEKANAAAQAAAPPAQAAPPGNALPPGVSTGAALPPGVNVSISAPPPGAAPANVSTAAPPPGAQPAAAQPAMPQAAPAPAAAPAANGAMTIEQFRAVCMQVQKERPGKMNLLMRAETWPSDNSAKATWFTAESVPEDLRSRLLDEMMFVP